MKTLKGTRTSENLMKAFVGECQATTKYLYYASKAKKEGYVQISNIFTETSQNEKEHAKLFLKFLDKDMKNEAIEIKENYSVSLGSTEENLECVAGGEKAEAEDFYPKFAQIAKEEGFDEIFKVFLKVAEVEKRHEERYKKLLQNIRNKQVFKKDKKVLWKCNNCGYIHEGEEAPDSCPACSHPRGYFEVFVENY